MVIYFILGVLMVIAMDFYVRQEDGITFFGIIDKVALDNNGNVTVLRIAVLFVFITFWPIVLAILLSGYFDQ